MVKTAHVRGARLPEGSVLVTLPARHKRVTPEAVRAALARLGPSATLRRVRQALGGGSLRDVSRMVKEVRRTPATDGAALHRDANFALVLDAAIEAIGQSIRNAAQEQAFALGDVRAELAELRQRMRTPPVVEPPGQTQVTAAATTLQFAEAFKPAVEAIGDALQSRLTEIEEGLKRQRSLDAQTFGTTAVTLTAELAKVSERLTAIECALATNIDATKGATASRVDEAVASEAIDFGSDC